MPDRQDSLAPQSARLTIAGLVVMAAASAVSRSPATVAAARRRTPTTAAARSASSVLLMATTRTSRRLTGTGSASPAACAVTCRYRPSPVHTGSVKACSSPPSSATRSSATAYQRLQVCPSSLVRSSTSTSPVRAGGAHVTPAMVKRMPASTVAAAATTASAAAGACTAPSAVAAARPAVETSAGPTGSAAGRLAVRNSTGGALIHVSTAELTRGATQTAATAPTTERMKIAASRAARLWG